MEKTNFYDILKELKEGLEKGPSLDTDAEVLMEFGSAPGSEIGSLYQDSIYMTFMLKDGDVSDDFLDEFLIAAPRFIEPLISYMSLLYKDNVGFRPSGFKIEIDTQDAETQDPELVYEIRVSVA